VLLLSIDPLASLAETQEQLHQRLLDLTPLHDADLRAAWQAAAEKAAAAPPSTDSSPLAPSSSPLIEQFYVILECRDEKHQVEMLKRFAAEGFKCKAALA
jgi:hypothetical protein